MIIAGVEWGAQLEMSMHAYQGRGQETQQTLRKRRAIRPTPPSRPWANARVQASSRPGSPSATPAFAASQAYIIINIIKYIYQNISQVFSHMITRKNHTHTHPPRTSPAASSAAARSSAAACFAAITEPRKGVAKPPSPAEGFYQVQSEGVRVRCESTTLFFFKTPHKNIIHKLPSGHSRRIRRKMTMLFPRGLSNNEAQIRGERGRCTKSRTRSAWGSRSWSRSRHFQAFLLLKNVWVL